MKATLAMIVSFSPWVLFNVIVKWAGPGHAAIAALIAFAVAAVLLIKNGVQSGVKILDAAGVATFGVLAVLAFLGGSAMDIWVADFGRGAVSLLLAAIMLISAVTIPFSEQYARESVAREYWHSAAFRATNRKISAMWGGVIALTGCAHLAAAAIDPVSGPVRTGQPIHVLLNVLLNWVVPIALIVLAAKQTKRMSAAAHDRAHHQSQPTPAPQNAS